MPSPKIMYLCKYCKKKEYPNYEECERHEKSHDVDFDGADAEAYQINNTIAGMSVKSFKSLMTEAAKKLACK